LVGKAAPSLMEAPYQDTALRKRVENFGGGSLASKPEKIRLTRRHFSPQTSELGCQKLTLTRNG
jgi:hypothetical protein